MTTDIRPYRIDIPQADLDDLRGRLAATRWPADVPGVGWTRGVPVPYLTELAAYWAGGFDWRTQEAGLNAYPHFMTSVDGQDIHFVHVRSGRPDALPLLAVHGWPSSFVEFIRIVEPLRSDFDLVIPSVPGFGFSTPLSGPGWGNLFRVAGAFGELMTRLGYDRYATLGGDLGAGIIGMLAAIEPHRVVGTYVTGPVPFPFGPPVDLDGLDGSDRLRAERFNDFQADGLGYLHLQSTRPQTLAYSLTDSPVGQLAWIVEKFREWTDPAADLPEDAVDRDQLLTVASVYWFTGSGASSAHVTYEGMQAFREYVARTGGAAAAPDPAAPPMGVGVFAGDNSVRAVLDPDRSIAHWAEFDRGGHFPAMEVPDLLAGDVRRFYGR